MKRAADNMTEGRAAFDAFSDAMRKIIAVPHTVIRQREAEYKRKSNASPNKRGPKPTGFTDDGVDDIVDQLRAKRKC